MPVLRSKPRHAKPQQFPGAKAVLIPVVLMGSSGAALGGLAISASAADGKAVPTAAVPPSGTADLSALADRALLSEQRAARSRTTAELTVAEQATAAQAARQAADQAAADRAAVSKGAAETAAAMVPAQARPGLYVRPGVGPLTSRFGARWGRQHKGIDLAGPYGSPVFATAAGTVIAAGTESGYGNAIRVRHADGTVTLYAHNSTTLVRVGQAVAAGQQIARVGSTGNVTGPNLHMEVIQNGGSIDPLPWLRARGVPI